MLSSLPTIADSLRRWSGAVCGGMRLAAIANKDKDLEEPTKELILGMDPALYERLYAK